MNGPRADERAAFVGATGSGKSFASRTFAARLPRLLFIDPKHDLHNPRSGHTPRNWRVEEWSRDTRRRLAKGEPVRTYYQPAAGDTCEDIFRKCFEEWAPVTLYVDEMYLITPTARPGFWLRACYTQGRSRGLGTWAATQRPRHVPLFMFTEAEWLFMFRLNHRDDRKVIAGMAGPEVMGNLHNRQLWVYNQNWEAAQMFDRIRA